MPMHMHIHSIEYWNVYDHFNIFRLIFFRFILHNNIIILIHVTNWPREPTTASNNNERKRNTSFAHNNLSAFPKANTNSRDQNAARFLCSAFWLSPSANMKSCLSDTQFPEVVQCRFLLLLVSCVCVCVFHSDKVMNKCITFARAHLWSFYIVERFWNVSYTIFFTNATFYQWSWCFFSVFLLFVHMSKSFRNTFHIITINRNI